MNSRSAMRLILVRTTRFGGMTAKPMSTLLTVLSPKSWCVRALNKPLVNFNT